MSRRRRFWLTTIALGLLGLGAPVGAAPRTDAVAGAGTFEDGQALLDAAPALRPDIIILDIAMPGLDGLETGRRLLKTMPRSKLIYLTVNEDPVAAAEAFRLGASGYLLKKSAASELFQAVSEVHQGRSYITSLMTRDTIESLRRAPAPADPKDRITGRQRDVLRLLAEGRTMKEVGSLLGITPRTVAHHKYTMMQSLDIENSAELVQFAVRNGIVSGP